MQSTIIRKALLEGRRGLIMGVANERSLAWGVAREALAHGAELVLSYPNEDIGKRVRALASGNEFISLLQCDVSSDQEMDAAFSALATMLGDRKLDFVVHAISMSDRRELDGPYIKTSRSNFIRAMDISCYSFTAVAQRAAPLMAPGGSLLTLSYLGAERVIPNYNVMGLAKSALEMSVRYLAEDLGPQGIRVNAISAGPIKTLASSGISGMRHIVQWSALNAPLRRSTTIEDVGRAALSLLSDLGQGVTGEIVHVDSGYHVVGMVALDGAAKSAELLVRISEEVEARQRSSRTESTAQSGDV